MAPDQAMTYTDRDREASRLIREYKATGDLALRDRVFALFVPLARCTLRRVPHPWQEDDDIYQEITIGLIAAVESFDPDFGVRFSTYAIAKMRGAALTYARKQVWGSRAMQDEAKRVEARRCELGAGASPTPEEVLNGGPQVPLVLLAPNSLDELRSRCDGEEMVDVRFLDALVDTISVEHEVLQQMMREEMRGNVNDLPPRERRVLKEYYWNGKNFREIGLLLKVSESRVFQLHGQAMSRLRRRMHRPNTDQEVPEHLLGNGRTADKGRPFRYA